MPSTQWRLLLHLLPLLALINLSSAWTKTPRKARVAIHNLSGQAMYNVSLLHKYSDVYHDNETYPVIWDGEQTPANRELTVRYNTGFLTTGVDWWVLGWVDDWNTPYVSDPLNFRQIADFLEKRTPRAISIAALTAVGLATAASAPVTAIAAAVAVAIVSQDFTAALFSNEDTSGWKQHTLRSEDADALTKIVILPDNVITFVSESGNSSTTISALRPRVLPEADMTEQDKELKNATENFTAVKASGAEENEVDEADAAMWKSAEDWLKAYHDKTRPNRFKRPQKKKGGQ